MQLTTVSSRPFRSCLACSLLSSCNLQTYSSLMGVFVGVQRPRLGCVCERYVSSCSWRLFSCSTVFSLSCSTRSLSCSSIIFWFRLHTRQMRHQAPWWFHQWLSMLKLTPAAPWSASPWRPAHLEGCWSASGGSLGETGFASLQHPESTRSVTLKPAMLLIKAAQKWTLFMLHLFFFDHESLYYGRLSPQDSSVYSTHPLPACTLTIVKHTN